MKAPLCLSAICLLAACTPLSPTAVQPQRDAPLQLQVEYQGQALSESSLPDFWVQHANGFPSLEGLKRTFTKLVKAWYERPRHSDFQRSPELLIADVQLTDTGTSVLGKGAPGSIVPDYAGKEVRLTLKGTFKDNRQALKLRNFRFTLEPPLVQQTFTFEGEEPQSRVLLNDSVLLEPVAVSANEIQVVLQTRQLLDLYLRGLHKITVEHGKWYTDALIQVGEPVPTTVDLKPRIETAEVLRDRGKPLHVRLEGDGFLVFPKLIYATVDGAFGFSYQTEILQEGASSLVVHIPDPAAFARQSSHTVMVATPFGVAFKNF